MSEDDVAGGGGYDGAAAGWGIGSGQACYAEPDSVASNIAQGSIAAYYPEANVLVALDHYEAKSGTPSYKSTPVLLRVRKNHEALRRLVESADD